MMPFARTLHRRIKHRRALLTALLALTVLGEKAHAQDSESPFAVYFPTGISALQPAAQKTLDSLVYRGSVYPGQRLTITGYADEPGTAELNNSLSLRRAQAVADYLTRDGFLRKEDIMTVSGRGYQAAKAGRGNNPRYRRADITATDGPPPSPRAVIPAPLPPQTPAPKPAPIARLDTMKANSTLTLKDVLFENNSDIVRPSSVPQLESLLAAMRENPSVRIRLEGHVCCGGPPGHGQFISEIRAKAVYDYLARNGIAKSRLAFQGYGFSRPLKYPELSEDDQWQNRRVEVRILGK